MREHRPSRTAAAVAYRRAAHQRLDHPLVFTDPLAATLLSPEARARLDAAPDGRSRRGLGARLRAFLAVRSRVAEDRLAAAVGRGVRQYLVLGAGLDTFAYRNPWPDLRVFEVDHPATQGWKRERVRAAELEVTPRTIYVPVDFERQSVAEELGRHGFDPALPTAISWLGVVPYLEPATIWANLAWAATIVGGEGHIVFDYGSAPPWWALHQHVAVWLLARRVAAAGEPFRSRLDPAELARRLAGLGFAAVQDLDAAELNRRYFAGRADGLAVAGTGRVVVAAR